MSAPVLVPVPVDKLDAARKFLAPFVETLVEITHGRMSADDLFAFAADGRFQVWAVLEGDAPMAVVTTEIIRYPRRKTCRIVGCAGHHKEKWIHLLSEIEAWARAEGCAAMEITARKGWAKVLADYKMTGILLERDL